MPQPKRYENPAQRQQAYRRRTAAARRAQLGARSLPPLPAIPTMPGRHRWKALLELAEWALETARDEMQEYYDDRSDAWQESDAGDSFDQSIQGLEPILDAIAAL